jgi:lysophospholipase L1-like esterase
MRAALACLIVLTLCAAGCSGGSPNEPTPNPTPTPQPPTPSPNPTPPAGPATPAPAAPRLGKTRFLAFGDSMTEGVASLPFTQTLVNIPHSYPARLGDGLRARYADQRDIAVVNEGKAGEFAVEGKFRMGNLIRADTPQVLLLLEGANDINVLGRQGVSRVAVAIEDMIKDAHARGVVVLVATLPRQRAGGRNADGAPFVEEVNALIRRITVDRGATVVDVYNQLDLSLIGEDGLHPTEAGYARLAEIFATAIRQAFETAPPS